MALDSWLSKVRSFVSSMSSVDSAGGVHPFRKRPTVGILAFEVAGIMSKLLHLWRSLSDPQLSRLCHEAIALHGVRKVVSDDDVFLLGLACAELADTLRLIADATSRLAATRCADPDLRGFAGAFKEFTVSGRDPHHWQLSWKEMEAKAKKMDRYVRSTAALYKEMDELAEAELGLRKLLHCTNVVSTKNLSLDKITAVADAQQKVFWQRQEVKCLKQSSLWSCTFDAVVALLAKSAFTVLARIKHVFGLEHGGGGGSPDLPRSSAVYPSSDTPPPELPAEDKAAAAGLFESSAATLVPPETTLGAAALAVRYANVIIVIERMMRSPGAVAPESRDDLYAMLPVKVKEMLRRRLRGVGGGGVDGGLATEWRAALGRIIGWLGPMAHNTVRWHGERSFERRSTAPAAGSGGGVMLLQTLYFANREKVEGAVAELLVGLNYVWRFEMEMNARVMLPQLQDHQRSNKCLEI